MNYFPFLLTSTQYMPQNSYHDYDLHQRFDEINEILAQKNNQIEFLKEKNHQMKQTIMQLSAKLQYVEKKAKPTRKITKNYYRKNACVSPDTNSRLYCPYNECRNHYSSILALNFHIKYKHDGGNKKQRQAYAKIIVQAELKGQEAPKIKFNFPPGFFEVIIDQRKKYRESYLKSSKLTELRPKTVQNQKDEEDSVLKSE